VQPQPATGDRKIETGAVHGHPLSGDDISYEPNGRRKCLACVRRREMAPRPPSEDQIERATAALNAGKTIKEICWGEVGERKICTPILSFRKLRLHRTLNPDFDRFVVSATADHNSKGQLRRFNRERASAEIVQAKAKPKTWVHHKMSGDKATRIRLGLRAWLAVMFCAMKGGPIVFRAPMTHTRNTLRNAMTLSSRRA
jgi:hypothetical protein